MASTCLSSTKSWKNDVFLSFRGEDTRKTFVGHLYYALNQKGIHTFKDDVRLERGKSISPELVKAIEQSRFAIVVFSKNYASSTWCLDELGKIMECKKELGLTVIPIFYDVDPSDVSKQSGSFAESFGRHEENLKEDVEKVQCWRDAFRQAGKIAGYDLPNAYDGYESNCIQHVVEDILSKLCQVISTIEKDLVGMESRMHEVSSLLRMETPDVRFIGIWGMSGIGKTTIANAVFDKYSDQFDGMCFLDNVSEIQRTRGLQYLQGVLLSKILKEAEAVEGLWIPRNYMPKQDISYYNINESFRRMKRLRVLVVRATNFCSVDPITHIPSSIRWLDWEGCPLNSLPQSFEPSKLLRLDILESTTLQKLWTISKGLDKLKTLYLSYCEHLEEVPSFSMMPNLERIKLEGCKSLREVSPSFGIHMKLTSVEVIDCPSLEKLPSCIQMGSLQSLKLSCLPKLRELPETKEIHCLLTLEVTNCQSLEKLPSCDQMESLETLKLSCLPKITTLPPLDGMHGLQELVVEYVPIVELPVSIGNLGSLKQLRLSHCKDLVSIPNSFCCLKSLGVLLIYNCKRLVELPEKMGDLKLLKKLVVYGTAISQLPPSVSDLGELNFCSFSRWSGYRQGATFLLPPASDVSPLRVLKLNKYTLCSGEHLLDLGGLSSLAHLDLTRNDFTSFSETTNLLFHYLDITFCEKIVLPELPPCIKELYAYDPLILKSIPDFPSKYSDLYSVSFTRHIENRGELTGILHFVLHSISVASQWEKRLPFSVFFPGDIRWNGFTYYRKEQTKRFSTQLDPCWYESKFKGFVICFRVPSVIGQNQKPSDAKSQRGSRRFGCAKVTAKLVQRYNRQEHDVLQKKCLIVARQTCCSHGSKYAICFSYIPFVSLWHSSDCEKGKKLPNDYCFFEASIDPDTATKWGLLLVYENKIQQIDQSAIAVQLDVESRNTDLFRVCNDDQGQKMEDASVKRRRLNFPQVMKDSYSPSECQTFQIIPDQQLEIPSSSATQSFQHREESYASEQPESIADPQVSEAIDDATSCMLLEQLEAPSSSEQPETFEFSPGEHKDNSVTTGSDCSEGFPQLETTCTSGQSQTLLLFPEHS